MTQADIDRIEAAETKDDLYPIFDAFGLTPNKRKGLETLRAELLEAAENTEEVGEAPASTPEAAPAPSTPTPAAPTPRLLRHTGNGRTFPWTAALAARRDMEEI